MSVMFDDNIIAIWFVDLEPAEDYLMSLSRRPEGGIRFVYRVRHHSPDSRDPFDDKDEKNWHAFETSDTDEKKAIEAARSMAKGLVGISVALGAKHPPPVYEFIRQPGATPEAFMKEFMKAPFVHVKQVTMQ